MLISDQQLISLLLENHLVTPEKIKIAQELSQKEHILLVEAILQKDLVSDEPLGRLIADYLQIPFVTLAKLSISDEILNIVPEIVARHQKLIAFLKDQNGLNVAVADPSNREPVSFIEKKTGEKVNVYLATERDIVNALGNYKKDLQKALSELVKSTAGAGDSTALEAPIAKIVDLLIEYAYQNKSSDIHIEPKEEGSLVRFRIDGVLHDVLSLPKAFQDQLITRIKVLSKLRTDEHLSAQDGKMQAVVEEEELDVRVSIVPIVEGEKAVLRLLSSKSRQFSLSELGMNEGDLEKVKKGYIKPYGMLLSTGPTGSGKTTTIYAILKIINTRDKNIATIEDPVEYDIEGINQIQVNSKTNLTFANGLRSILRQDPDIIFVGEVRDEETADIAINSAMTGHLVLSTIHTNDAATTLPRLIDMHIEPFLIASTVNVIIGQRLVRKICEKCKVSITIKVDELALHLPVDLIGKYFTNKKEVRGYQGKGCLVCHNSGYVGRVGIFEVLEVTESIRKLVSAKANADEVKKKAVEEGMTLMLEDGLKKIESGVTTIDEVIRVSKE